MASSSEHDATAHHNEATTSEPQPLAQLKEEPKDLAELTVLVVVVQLNEYWTTSTTSEANLEMLRRRDLLPKGYLWTQPKVRTT
jgi:hypothetical protein